MIPTEEEIAKKCREIAKLKGGGSYYSAYYDCRCTAEEIAKWMLERLRPYLIEWIGVEDERKPEEGETIFCRAITNLGEPFYISLLVQGGYLLDNGCTYDFDYFTHWARIPLPEAKK